MESRTEIKRRFCGKDLERVREIFEESERDYKLNREKENERKR